MKPYTKEISGGLCHNAKSQRVAIATKHVGYLIHAPLASVPLDRSQRWNTWSARTLVTISDTQGRI